MQTFQKIDPLAMTSVPMSYSAQSFHFAIHASHVLSSYSAYFLKSFLSTLRLTYLLKVNKWGKIPTVPLCSDRPEKWI